MCGADDGARARNLCRDSYNQDRNDWRYKIAPIACKESVAPFDPVRTIIRVA